MSPTWLPARAWATPAASASCVTCSSRSTPDATFPTGNVAAASACSATGRTGAATLDVVGDEGGGIGLGHLEAGLDRRGRVVRATLLGGAARQAAQQLFLRHVEQQNAIEALAVLAQRGVNQLRLRGGAREAVEDGTVLRVGIRELFLDETEDHAVGDELAVVHVLLRLAAERGAFPHGGAEDVPSGDFAKAQALCQNLALGALTGPRRAEQEDEQGLSAGTARGWCRSRVPRPA